MMLSEQPIIFFPPLSPQFMEDHPEDPPLQIRKHLGAMGVSGALQVKPIYTLSGGQKSRVALAMITYE